MFDPNVLKEYAVSNRYDGKLAVLYRSKPLWRCILSSGDSLFVARIFFRIIIRDSK